MTHPSSVSTRDILFPFLIWLQAKYLSCFNVSLDIILILTSAPWCSVYQFCSTSFNKVWALVLCRFKSSSRHVKDLWWWESLTVIPAGNKCLTPRVNQPLRKNHSIHQPSWCLQECHWNTDYIFTNFSVIFKTTPALATAFELVVFKWLTWDKWKFLVNIKASNKNTPISLGLFKVNNRNIKRKFEICSKLTTKTSDRQHWRCFSIFTVSFKQISNLALVFLLLTLSRKKPASK